ncbi:hypothetical protein Pan153_62770 [Gimesia panareensis]|uniref:Uncharacterized protein n=1 Tax=Gimesia panareensis TaxID=2527978 RepID=A0A518FYZ0_9PLAN|nr:hypothetical protein [Gimesia panareensis]QDV21587.1 hypothetical protein Pan153_62770 [Gimesia panareensis]
MSRFRLLPVLALFQLCWLPLAIAETDSTSAPLTAKKPQPIQNPQHVEFSRWRALLIDWRDLRDQLRTARVKVIGEEQSFYREQQAKGTSEFLIFRKIFELNGQLDQGNELQRWTTTHFEAQNEIHVQLSDAERARFWLRNGIPSTLSRPQRIWKGGSNPLRSLFYWNPLYAGFNQFSLIGHTYGSQTEADRWYKGFLNTGITDQRDSITFRRNETTGLLLVKLKRFCPINHKPGIVISELCFNERQGFTLLSHKRWLYFEKRKQPELPFLEVTVNWKQIDSVWVPTSMTTVTNYGLHVTSLKLEWSHLNEPLKQSDPPSRKQDAPLDWSKIMLL